MTGNTIETRLVGDFKHSGPEFSKEKANKFLLELEILMEQYKIEKIDICWIKFTEFIQKD